MTTVLITGFEPFGKASLNPSSEILKHITGDNIVTGILPVTYSQSADRLLKLIGLHNPDVVICLGQAEGRNQITPEKIAINLDDARIPDNEGVIRTHSAIVADGPDGYFSTLPVAKIVEAIKAQEIPCSLSLSAGTFLCNHIFYVAQHYLKSTNVMSGFVHVPLMDEQAPEFPGLYTMPLTKMVTAVHEIISTTKNHMFGGINKIG